MGSGLPLVEKKDSEFREAKCQDRADESSILDLLGISMEDGILISRQQIFYLLEHLCRSSVDIYQFSFNFDDMCMSPNITLGGAYGFSSVIS